MIVQYDRRLCLTLRKHCNWSVLIHTFNDKICRYYCLVPANIASLFEHALLGFIDVIVIGSKERFAFLPESRRAPVRDGWALACKIGDSMMTSVDSRVPKVPKNWSH